MVLLFQSTWHPSSSSGQAGTHGSQKHGALDLRGLGIAHIAAGEG